MSLLRYQGCGGSWVFKLGKTQGIKGLRSTYIKELWNLLYLLQLYWVELFALFWALVCRWVGGCTALSLLLVLETVCVP